MLWLPRHLTGDSEDTLALLTEHFNESLTNCCLIRTRTNTRKNGSKTVYFDCPRSRVTTAVSSRIILHPFPVSKPLTDSPPLQDQRSCCGSNDTDSSSRFIRAQMPIWLFSQLGCQQDQQVVYTPRYSSYI